MARDYSHLDLAFGLPPSLSDPSYVELYNVIIAEMRADARGVQLDMTLNLLIERIATYYVTMKSEEQNPTVARPSPEVQKNRVTFWLSMVQEYHKLLKQRTPMDKRIAVLKEVQSIVLDTLDCIGDPKLKERLTTKFIENFTAAGVTA